MQENGSEYVKYTHGMHWIYSDFLTSPIKWQGRISLNPHSHAYSYRKVGAAASRNRWVCSPDVVCIMVNSLPHMIVTVASGDTVLCWILLLWGRQTQRKKLRIEMRETKYRKNEKEREEEWPLENSTGNKWKMGQNGCEGDERSCGREKNHSSLYLHFCECVCVRDFFPLFIKSKATEIGAHWWSCPTSHSSYFHALTLGVQPQFSAGTMGHWADLWAHRQCWHSCWEKGEVVFDYITAQWPLL